MLPVAPSEDVGRWVIVTGATSGIGEATAAALLRRGNRVVGVARDRTRIEATRARFRAAGIGADMPWVVADLSVIAEVRRAAEEVRALCPRIDVLVNNAGAVFTQREVTSEGHERTWALNVLTPHLLSHLLFDRLAASGNGRVVNVASEAHRGAHLDLDDLVGARQYAGFRAYSRSKLALIMLTYELARRRAGSGVTVNALHPGFVASRFGKNTPGAFRTVIGVVEALFGIRPERAARTVVFCATAPELDHRSGEYFARRRARRSSAASYDRSVSDALWTLVSRTVGLPSG